MKICTRCKQEKELDQFSKWSKTKDGLQRWCKDCHSAYFKENKEKLYVLRNKRRKDYYWENTEKQARKKVRIERREHYLFINARRRALKSGIEFNISEKDIIIPEMCPLLKKPLSKEMFKGNPYSPSIDRKDNSKGYIKGNIWIISTRANRMKLNATFEELQEFSKNITKQIKHWNK